MERSAVNKRTGRFRREIRGEIADLQGVGEGIDRSEGVGLRRLGFVGLWRCKLHYYHTTQVWHIVSYFMRNCGLAISRF